MVSLAPNGNALDMVGEFHIKTEHIRVTLGLLRKQCRQCSRLRCGIAETTDGDIQFGDADSCARRDKTLNGGSDIVKIR